MSNNTADKNIEAINVLIKGIDTLIENKMSGVTQILTGVITNVNVSEGLYSVVINGNTYTEVSSITDTLSVGVTVKVVIPQGQYNQMFILGYIH